MNKIRLTLVALFATLGLTFQSCNDDDHYSLGDFSVDWATVISTTPGTYYLKSDTWGTLWPAATSLPGYRPKDGQRVIALFNPLADNFQGFDHAIKVEGIDEILTKELELLTSQNDEEYGNDPLYIKEDGLWLSGGFLNVAFVQNMPSQKKHRISLVTPIIQTDENGYVALELRYNNYDDVTGWGVNGYVSFDLRSLYEKTDVKGISLRYHMEDKGEQLLVFDF